MVTRARARATPQVALDFDDPAALVCGVDEVGRGPLAGPVVAAAIIFDTTKPSIRGLADSKVLSAARREALYEKIASRALAFCVASASVEEIDSINILHATMLAMQRAVLGLAVAPGLVKVDGNRCPVLPMRSEAVIGGDATVPLISAASILAKVVRDRMLAEFHQQHPEYGFDEHAGYSTPKHLAALRQHGPCIHHRHSFEPVRIACGAFGVTAREYAVRGAAPDDLLNKGGVLLRGGSFGRDIPEVVARPMSGGAPLVMQASAHEKVEDVSFGRDPRSMDSCEGGSV